MANDKLIIRGARENNLKNISLEIPKNKLVVMTGLSGSGKTSLAFDTIYAEGQRRYVESLSAYARQFLGGVDKPDVEMIEGLSPAISIDQKTTSNNPRSTVGTVTEIYDYLRLLYARCGVPYCPNHNIPITGKTIQEMVASIMELEDRTRLTVMAPVVRDKKGTFKDTFEKLMKDGYVRVRVDGEMRMLEDDITLEKNKRHRIDVVVDRIIKNEDSRSRIQDSLETALKLTMPSSLLMMKKSCSLQTMHVRSAVSRYHTLNQDSSPSTPRLVPVVHAMALALLRKSMWTISYRTNPFPSGKVVSAIIKTLWIPIISNGRHLRYCAKHMTSTSMHH